MDASRVKLTERNAIPAHAAERLVHDAGAVYPLVVEIAENGREYVRAGYAASCDRGRDVLVVLDRRAGKAWLVMWRYPAVDVHDELIDELAAVRWPERLIRFDEAKRAYERMRRKVADRPRRRDRVEQTALFG